jgi:DNA-binding CsgD family transcriptional regulator
MATLTGLPADGSEIVARVVEIIRLSEEALGVEFDLPKAVNTELGIADTALSATRQELAKRLGLGSAADSRIATLIIRAEQVQLALKDTLLTLQRAELESAKAAVNRLRAATSTEELGDRVPAEAYQMGFTRVLFSRIEKGTWLPRSAFVWDDQDMAYRLVEVGTANPRRLVGRLLECDMVRKGAPILVRNPRTDPRVHPELISVTNTPAYVAAPVFCYGKAIGLIHADRHTETSGVHEFDRDALGMFAEGLGIAFERNLIIDRVQIMRRAADEHLRVANSLADDFTLEVVEQAGPAPGSAEEYLSRAALRDQRVRPRHPRPLGALTSRESDVLRAMATGKTNAQIAATLFVTEGTVKSHAKRIFRKLGSKNRTEAVIAYQRAYNPWARSSDAE